MYSFDWFNCCPSTFGEGWILYAGCRVIGIFPTRYLAYKKCRYLQSLLDDFEFDKVRMEIDLLTEDMRDGR